MLSGKYIISQGFTYRRVPPIYLDELSRKMGKKKIEHAASFEALDSFPYEMIRSYCLLTKKYSLPQLSYTVKEAVTFINLNFIV